MKIKKLLKKADDAFMNKGRQIEESIKEYMKKAPERRKEEIQKLKDQLEIERYKAKIKKERERYREKEDLDFGIKF